MDFFKNSSLIDFYNLGKLFLAFEKIYKLKRENDLLKKTAIKNGDQNLEVYKTNSMTLNLITIELLNRGKNFYDKLKDKDKIQVKSYLNKLKVLTVQNGERFSTINGLPYCTCHEKQEKNHTFIDDLNELYNKLHMTNKKVKDVQSVNKDLKEQLESLTEEFTVIKKKVSNPNSSAGSSSSDSEKENANEQQMFCKNNKKEHMNEAQIFLTKIQETISTCLNLTSSKDSDIKYLATGVVDNSKINFAEPGIVTLEVVEVINVKPQKTENNDRNKHTVDKTETDSNKLNESVDKNKPSNEIRIEKNHGHCFSDEDDNVITKNSNSNNDANNTKTTGKNENHEKNHKKSRTAVINKSNSANDKNIKKNWEKYSEPDIQITFTSYTYENNT